MDILTQDEHWMHHALKLAEYAELQGEVPVGAVVVSDGEIVGEGWNQSIGLHDPSAHAEVMAIRAAAQKIENYRLVNCDLYVTLEPCLMCAGALIHARIRRLIFGATDPKTGVAGSVENTFKKPFLNHRIAVTGGVLASSCTQEIQRFFRQKRQSPSKAKG